MAKPAISRPQNSKTDYISVALPCAAIPSELLASVRQTNEKRGHIMTAKRKDKGTAPLTNQAGEVRELKADDFAKFQPADEVIPGIAEGM
jgi:hypothetical protein